MAQLYKKTGTCSGGDGTTYPMYLVVGESAGGVFSSELVTNGGFDSNTTGWAGYQGTIASVAGGYSGNCCQLTHTSGEYNSNQQIITGKLIVGRRYRLSGYVKSGTSGDENYRIGVQDSTYTYDASITGTSSGEWVYVSADFTHANNDTWVIIRHDKLSGTAGTMLFDSISIVEIPQVHCDAHCKTDFRDTRFHDAADAELKYMIDWGSLTGTTPNQTVGVWVATSPWTSDTNVVLKYGDSSLTDASTSTIFTRYDGAERGSDGDAVGGDWTVTRGNVKITTDVACAGTRSIEFTSETTNLGTATIPVTASANIAIQFRARKIDVEGMTLQHGDGSTRAFIKWDTDENIYPYVSGDAYGSSLGVASHSAWHKFEFCNFDWSANTWDLWVDDVQIGDGITQGSDGGLGADKFYASNRANAGAVYIDEFIVRKYASPEPTWGTWGAEEEIGSTPTGPSGIKALGPTASASIKAYGPTAWGSVKAL